MPMTFTKLDFDTYAASKINDLKAQLAKLDGAERAKARKAGADQYSKEMNRQLDIYTKEETAYIKFLLSLHTDSKQLVQGIVTDVKALQNKFDKKVVGGIGTRVGKLVENWKHVAGSRKNLAAHQAMRNNPLKAKEAVEVFGMVDGPKIHGEFVKRRKPLIDALASVSDKVTKVEEFVKRGEDLQKAAESLNKRHAVNFKRGLQEFVAAQKETTAVWKDIDIGNSKVQDALKYLNSSLKAGRFDQKSFKGQMDLTQNYQKGFKANKSKVKTVSMKYDALKKRFGDLKEAPDFKRAFGNLEKLLQMINVIMEAYMVAVDSHADVVKKNKKQFKL